MSRREVAGFAVGASPRVDLLPPEVRAGQQDRQVRRWFILGALLALVVVVGGYALATLVAVQAQSALDQAQARTDDLLAQQQQYAEVRDVQRQLDIASAATTIGSSTEVDWADYVRKLSAVLPGGATLTAVSVDGATPFEAYPQPTAPLQVARIATLRLTATSPTLPDVSSWIDAMVVVPGISSVAPVSISGSDAGFAVEFEVTLSRAAWSNQPEETEVKP